MAATATNRFKFRLASGAHDWDATGKIAVVLETRSTSAGADLDPDLNTLADILALAGVTEAAGPGAARVALAGLAVTEDDANNRAILDANDVTWAGANWGDAALVVICESAGATDAEKNLVSMHDGGLPVTMNGADWTYAWPATGVVTLS